MGIIKEEEGAVAPHHFAKLAERGDIPEHAVEAFHNDEGALAAIAEATQALVEVRGVVVAEAIDFGAGKLGPFVDAGVGVGVEHDDVPGAREGRDCSHVGHVTGGESDGGTRPEKSAELPLERRVTCVGAIGQARARGPRPMGAHRLGRSLDAGGIKGKAEVIVRAGQDDALAFNFPSVADPVTSMVAPMAFTPSWPS